MTPTTTAPTAETPDRCPECRCRYGPTSTWGCRNPGCDCHVEWESEVNR